MLAFVGLDFIVSFVFGLCMFGGPDTLALATHVALLSLLGLGEKLMDIFDVGVGPGEVFYSADGLDPCALSWETLRAMEVSDGRLETREIIDVVDCLPWWGSVLNEHRKVFNNCSRPRYLVHCVEGVVAVRAVDEECVGVEVFDLEGEGNIPECRPRAPPPFE